MEKTKTLTDNHMEICIQLDFYGQLLTGRMREFLDLHYTHDLSLAEIAENLGVSRQAVHDRIRQGIKLLAEYETKLGLVARYRAEKKALGEILDYLEHNELQIASEQLRRIYDQL